jgi:hypothetical protein
MDPGGGEERKVETDVRILYRDRDPLKHVNNAVYVTYLEEARAAFHESVVGRVRRGRRRSNGRCNTRSVVIPSDGNESRQAAPTRSRRDGRRSRDRTICDSRITAKPHITLSER